jgi:ankyrin repeat protein
LIPLATSDYWNSGTPYSFNFRDGHSPLMDAIMSGNFDIVKMLIPLTNLRYGCYLHGAVRYGHFEIFKHLCGLLDKWKTLKDKKGRTVNQILCEKNYLVEVNDMMSGEINGSPKFASKIVSDNIIQEMLKFIDKN